MSWIPFYISLRFIREILREEGDNKSERDSVQYMMLIYVAQRSY